MFKHSKIALGVAACVALSGCLEVEDNNNEELVAQLEKQNDILQAQLDEDVKRAEAWKTAITLSGKVALATEGDTLPNDVMLALYYDGKWHDAITLSEGGAFQITELPSGAQLIAKVSSPSNAIVTQNFFIRTEYNRDKYVQEVLDLVVGQPETIEFTVLDSETNLPFENLQLEASLNSYHEGYVSSAFRNVVADNVSKAELNTATGNYELVVPKGVDLTLKHTTDLDKDGMNDVQHIGMDSSNDLKFKGVTYLSKQEREQYELALTFLAPDGSQLKPEHVFATNNDFGANKATFNESTQTFTLAADYLGELNIHIPSFEAGGTTFEARQIDVQGYNSNEDTYSVYGVGERWNAQSISNQNGVVSVVVQLSVDEEEHSSIDVVSATKGFNPETHAFSYYFSTSIEIADSTDTSFVHRNALIATPGNKSTTDDVEPGYTKFEYTDVDIPFTSALTFNDTALTFTPESKLVEGQTYQLALDKLINKKSGELEWVNDTRDLTVYSSADFNVDLFKADNFNYRKGGEVITKLNTADQDASEYSSNESYRACVVLPTKHNVTIENVELQSLVLDGKDTEFARTNTYGGWTRRFYQLAANEIQLNHSVEASTAQPNDTYRYYCIEAYDVDDNQIMFKDNTESSENSISVVISYYHNDVDYNPIATEAKLYID